ncbi:nucleoside hydrolase 3-like [Aristolochia californica]|uniref:nucleoside hydrolase 3-like n=1 Tax=Aristolochia californica TaxID=171875 RepID=UPI0035DDFE7A
MLLWASLWLLLLVRFAAVVPPRVKGVPHRILLDTDMDMDDFFALLYLLKLNKSEFDVTAVTVNANAWTNAGHAVNHIYDILYMMGRDDIPVGAGGEGGILPDDTILPDVGGYLPLIEQGILTAGGCRYRQAIPVGFGGRLYADSNFGVRRAFLPQGNRKYSPCRQPTAQQVMIDAISAGPVNIFVIGAHTNLAIFLMSNPRLKKNIEHIYVMGGGVRSKNPTGCCPKNADSSCKPQQCGDPGNLFTGYTSNPYAEFNIFGDPFAAYQVIHSGIPITLIPLDATNTIPVTEEFFTALEQNQHTYEALYCFRSLKLRRDTWISNKFYKNYFMWDSFMAGVAISVMRKKEDKSGENEFAKMAYLNITVITSNKPYGIADGSNPFFDGRAVPKLNLQKNGVHSGHVQTGLQDLFCIVKNGKGKCEDGYTKEITSPDVAHVLVAQKAKPNQDKSSPLDKEFFKSFLEVINLPQQTGRFNFTTQFPYYKEVLYTPTIGKRKLGKSVIFDMDMSAGDFLALIYLLKVPTEIIDLKGVLVSGNGWANAATIDIIYDILHMMGRDDLPVGLGSFFALQQRNPSFPATGDCKYIKAIPHGSGGFLDSDTLYGFSRSLPRSPRRYTAENSVKHGAPRDTVHPQLRQPLAVEVWDSILKSLKPGKTITILTNGPLSNLAEIISSDRYSSSRIQEIYIVGGHIKGSRKEGNLFTVPSNKYAEFNMFLDPLAAKAVLGSKLRIMLIPLNAQSQVCSFTKIIEGLQMKSRTPEAVFARRLLSRMFHLQQKHQEYYHMDIFLGEVLGAVILAHSSLLNSTTQAERVSVLATGDISRDGQIVIDNENGELIKILDRVDAEAYYDQLSSLLSDERQAAVIGSFNEQKRMWSTPNQTELGSQYLRRTFLKD